MFTVSLPAPPQGTHPCSLIAIPHHDDSLCVCVCVCRVWKILTHHMGVVYCWQ